MRRDLSSGKAVVKSEGKSCYRVKRQRASKANKSKPPAAEESISSGTSGRSPTPPASSFEPQTALTATTEIVRRLPHVPLQQSSTIPYQLAHVNDTTRFIQYILTDIRSHVCNVFTRLPNWQHSQATKIGLIKAYDYLSYDHFVIAMDAFVKNEHRNGGEILRRAFLEVEDAIQTDYSSTFYFLFIDLPDLFLHYNRHDILTILLGHIKRLTGSAHLRDKISGTGFAALHALAETDPAHLQHYITTASALWCDLLSELRGPRDRSALLAKRNFLRHARGANTAYRVGQLWDDYTILMSEVQKQFGPGHDMSRHMEDVILSTQMIHDFFVDGFVSQNERLIQGVEDKYRVVKPHTLNPPLPPALPSTSPTINHAVGSLPPTTATTPTTTRSLSSSPVTNNPIIIRDNVTIMSPPNDRINNDRENSNMVPVDAWDVLDRSIRSNCYHRLAYFFSRQDPDPHRALYYTRKAAEGWRYSFWQLEAETALVWAGRHFEAESLRRCRLEAQYFRKLPESGQMIAPGHNMTHALPIGRENEINTGLMGGGALMIDESLFVSSTPSNTILG